MTGLLLDGQRMLAAVVAAVMLAWASVAAQAAPPPGRDVRARERPSETAERREREARTERGIEHLPAEFRRSWLYAHEGRSVEPGGETSHTLRKHVPERFNEQAILRVIEPREARYQELGTTNRPPLSVYKDLPHAERAIRSTLQSHDLAIQQWLRDPGARDVKAIEGRHAEPVGVVYERPSPSQAIDLSQRPREVNTNIVVLQKSGKGYYILTSYPAVLP